MALLTFARKVSARALLEMAFRKVGTMILGNGLEMALLMVEMMVAGRAPQELVFLTAAKVGLEMTLVMTRDKEQRPRQKEEQMKERSGSRREW